MKIEQIEKFKTEREQNNKKPKIISSKRILHLEIPKHHQNSVSKCVIMLAEGEVTLCQKLLVKICTNKFEVPTQIIFGISPHGQNFPLNLSSSKTNNSIGY